jgi:SSS family solute:Na+ symporter
LIYFPLQKGEDPELVYPKMMAKLLPVGFKGLMTASFLAVFMSTVNSMLNLGASYLINDIYIPFICKTSKSERHYVLASRIAVVFVLIIAIVFSLFMNSITMAWKYLAEIVGGASFVLIMRWFWWRINAWSEISAMAASFLIANLFRFIPGFGADEYFGVRFGVNIIVSTMIWITVTLLTRPAGYEHLKDFYIKIQPEGWWKPFKNIRRSRELIRFKDRWIGWIWSVISLYSGLFGIGCLCFGNYLKGILLLILFLIFGQLAFNKMRLILK